MIRKSSVLLSTFSVRMACMAKYTSASDGYACARWLRPAAALTSMKSIRCDKLTEIKSSAKQDQRVIN
jgi:hypothetical protein